MIQSEAAHPATTHQGGRWFPDVTADSRCRSGAARPTLARRPAGAPGPPSRDRSEVPPAPCGPRRFAMNSRRRSRTARRWSPPKPAVSRRSRHARRRRAADGASRSVATPLRVNDGRTPTCVTAAWPTMVPPGRVSPLVTASAVPTSWSLTKAPTVRPRSSKVVICPGARPAKGGKPIIAVRNRFAAATRSASLSSTRISEVIPTSCLAASALAKAPHWTGLDLATPTSTAAAGPLGPEIPVRLPRQPGRRRRARAGTAAVHPGRSRRSHRS